MLATIMIEIQRIDHPQGNSTLVIAGHVDSAVSYNRLVGSAWETFLYASDVLQDVEPKECDHDA